MSDVQPQPQQGDIWEVRIPTKRMIRKQIGEVGWRWFGEHPKQKKRSYIAWYREPKGRYSGIWLDRLLLFGKRISTKAERDAETEARFKSLPRGKGEIRRDMSKVGFELAEYASYAEIVGAVTHNREQIRKCCDQMFAFKKELDAQDAQLERWENERKEADEKREAAKASRRANRQAV